MKKHNAQNKGERTRNDYVYFYRNKEVLLIQSCNESNRFVINSDKNFIVISVTNIRGRKTTSDINKPTDYVKTITKVISYVRVLPFCIYKRV